MIGRFLLGAFSGVALVASGLIAGSALFPLVRPTEEPLIKADDPETIKPEEPAETAAETTETPATEEAEAQVDEPVVGEVASEPASAEAEPAGEPSPETAQPETAQPETAQPETAPPEIDAAALEAPDPAVPDAADETTDPAAVASPTSPEAPAAPALLTEDPAASAAAPAEAPAVPETLEAAPEAEDAAAVPEPEPEPEPTPEAGAEAAPEALPEALPEPETEAQPEASAEPEPEAAPSSEGEASSGDETGTAESGSTFAPSPGFASAGAITDGDDEAEAETAETLTDSRPITVFAASFSNPENKPVLAIVLVDPGTDDIDRDELAALPLPVSFALDPMDPATPERAAIYRAAGREVIMLATGIAEGSQASDVEVAFQSMSQRMPEAVAVMDLFEAVFQDNRPLASLVVPVIGAEGRGVLSWDKGLNAADQVARRDDIASAVIFRDLATGGGDAAATKRTLDRAVFKAGQDGRVVVAGVVTPELIAGLLEWSVEGRSAAVALGPVTAVLQVD